MATSIETITSMYDELYKKKQADLEKAKNTSLTNLDSEKETTEKGYYADRNKAYSQNVQNTQASVNTQTVYVDGQKFIVFTSGCSSMAIVKK